MSQIKSEAPSSAEEHGEVVKPQLSQVKSLAGPDIMGAAKLMAAQMEAQAHVQAQAQLKTMAETDLDDHSDNAPPSTRLHQLALAESKMSVAD